MSSSTTSILHVTGCRCEDCLLLVIPESPCVDSCDLETKVTLLKSALRSAKSNVRRGGKNKTFNGLKPIRVKLWSTAFGLSSSAATALSSSSLIALTTGNFPELSTFMVVYDELRMVNFKAHYRYTVTTPASAAPMYADWVFNIQFDPSVGAPSSISSASEESYTSGPHVLYPGVNGASIQSGDMMLPYKTLVAKVPKLAPITGQDCPGSSWIALDSATAPTMGVCGIYSTALGTSGVVSVRWYVELDVELRLRT